MLIGDRPTTLVNRAMNADRLRNAVRARLSTECRAPRCATISANARAIWGSLSSEKRSTQRSIERSERDAGAPR